jgi:hypothetical protein
VVAMIVLLSDVLMEGDDRLYNEDQICWGEWRTRANMYEGKRSRRE